MIVLREKEAEELLKKEGFPVIRGDFADSLSECLGVARKLGFPIVLKIVGKGILHKSDVGGVILNVKTNDELKDSYKKLSRIKGFEGVLVQKQTDGNFLLLGLKKDNIFGHVVALGTGGIYTEIMRDVTFRVCPIKRNDARQMIQEIKSYQILLGARGGKKADLKKLENLLIKLSRLPSRYENIEELDINPLIINDKEAVVADARIVFS